MITSTLELCILAERSGAWGYKGREFQEGKLGFPLVFLLPSLGNAKEGARAAGAQGKRLTAKTLSGVVTLSRYL